jgi:ABC-type branched-subunit amino acid transport system permease subunit
VSEEGSGGVAAGSAHAETMGEPTMSRSSLYLVIIVLAVGAAVAGYLYYQESQTGVDIRIDSGGVSIDGK